MAEQRWGEVPRASLGSRAVAYARSFPYDAWRGNLIVSYGWKEWMMATKLPGETYRGNALHVPLSADGQIALYVWPLRILSIRGEGCGGPTIGVDVGNEEVLRFNCHDTPGGHWHGGGYDRLATPRASLTVPGEDAHHAGQRVDGALASGDLPAHQPGRTGSARGDANGM